MSERRCGECRYGEANTHAIICQRFPPLPVWCAGYVATVYPSQGANRTCGEFKPKEEESQCSRCRHVRGHGRPRPAMPCKKFKPKEVKPVEPAVFCKTCKHWEATGFNAFMQPLTGRCHKGCGVNNARHTCPKHEEAAEPRTCRECKWYRADVVVNRRTEGDCTHPTPINGRTRETYNCDVFDRFKE